MPTQISHYLPFYIGCDTNKGKLVGITQHFVLIQSEKGSISEDREFSIKLFLRKLNKISADEGSELIKLGFSIGRPAGYSFSPRAFLYLLSLHVDLFGLIDSGLAIDRDLITPINDI